MEDRTGREDKPLTGSQEFVTGTSVGAAAKYRRLAVGEDMGLLHLAAYELLTGLLGPMPGAAGYFLRQKLYRGLLRRMGPRAAIGRNVTLRHPSRISLGEGVAIDDYVLLEARDGELVIGDRTMISRQAIISTRGGSIHIGDHCSIGSGVRLATLGRVTLEDYVLVAANCYLGGGDHRFDRLDVPVISQGMAEQKGVVIGRGAWIGTGAMVMDGVTVGHDAIIGAASLVTQDIPALAVAVGRPARVIRLRGEGPSEA